MLAPVLFDFSFPLWFSHDKVQYFPSHFAPSPHAFLLGSQTSASALYGKCSAERDRWSSNLMALFSPILPDLFYTWFKSILFEIFFWDAVSSQFSSLNPGLANCPTGQIWSFACMSGEALLEHGHACIVTTTGFILQWQTVVATEGYITSKAKNIIYLAICRINLLTLGLNDHFRFLYALSCAVNAYRE